MIDRTMLYDILYALAARGGRQKVLFGDDGPLAHAAFERSLAGDAFPEVWFELPLAGDPWFDLHVLTARETLTPQTTFSPQLAGDHPELFAWFARQQKVRQLALSYDVSQGDIDHPAVQLLMSTFAPSVTCDFLETAGGPEAAQAYRSFLDALPHDWYPCYMGLFPRRGRQNVRVECIVRPSLQRAYARDASLLAAHLRQVGFQHLDDTMLDRCQLLARSPYPLEFQLDIQPDGTAGSTLGASLRFNCPPGTAEWRAFEPDGAGGELMCALEDWGLADDRWRLFPDLSFAQHVSFKGNETSIFLFPAFVKLRWRDGAPLDAKTYLMGGVS